VATISDGLGDPGVAPDAPDITVSASTHTTICIGPTVPASRITVSTDAVAVLFAEAPFDALEGADVLGFAFPGGGWTTQYEGEVYAAAIDSEGELSSWVGPENLAHCATVSTPTAGWATTMGLLAALLRRRRPSARPTSL
jgi:MYXO-CTERM domain-containing protein